MNCIVNTSIILMGTMMGALTEAMVNVTGAMASGIAGAMDGKETEEPNRLMDPQHPHRPGEYRKTVIP